MAQALGGGIMVCMLVPSYAGSTCHCVLLFSMLCFLLCLLCSILLLQGNFNVHWTCIVLVAHTHTRASKHTHAHHAATSYLSLNFTIIHTYTNSVCVHTGVGVGVGTRKVCVRTRKECVIVCECVLGGRGVY